MMLVTNLNDAKYKTAEVAKLNQPTQVNVTRKLPDIVREVAAYALTALTPKYRDLKMIPRAFALLEAIHFCDDHRLVLLVLHAFRAFVTKHFACTISADAAAPLPWSQLEECVLGGVRGFVTSAFALGSILPAGAFNAQAFTRVRQHCRLIIWACSAIICSNFIEQTSVLCTTLACRVAFLSAAVAMKSINASCAISIFLASGSSIAWPIASLLTVCLASISEFSQDASLTASAIVMTNSVFAVCWARLGDRCETDCEQTCDG